MMKVLKRLEIQGTYLTIIMVIYSNPQSASKREKLRTRQGCPLISYLFNVVFEILIEPEDNRRTPRNTNRNVVKVSSFLDDSVYT